jgi:hypothetical protein
MLLLKALPFNGGAQSQSFGTVRAKRKQGLIYGLMLLTVCAALL